MLNQLKIFYYFYETDIVTNTSKDYASDGTADDTDLRAYQHIVAID